MSFRLAGGDNPLILIPGEVNGRGPFTFILDTGAGTSLLSRRLADELGIASGAGRPALGAGGAVTVAMARAESLAIGGACRAPMSLAVTAEVDRIGEAVGERIDGDLGYDFLRAYRVTIDYRRQMVGLAQGAFDVAGDGDRSRDQVAFRLASPVKPLTMVPVFLGGKGPFQFALDTGACTTVVSAATAAALGLERGETVSMTGAGGTLQATLGRVESLAVGTAVREGLSVTVADFLDGIGRAVGATLDGIVGYNFLRHFRLTIDYPGGVLWLVTAS